MGFSGWLGWVLLLLGSLWAPKPARSDPSVGHFLVVLLPSSGSLPGAAWRKNHGEFNGDAFLQFCGTPHRLNLNLGIVLARLRQVSN